MTRVHHRRAWPQAIALILALLAARPAAIAQVATAAISTNQSCTSPEDLEHCAGVLALLQDRGNDYRSWQMDLSARGGPNLGFDPLDVAGNLVKVNVDRFLIPPASGQILHLVAIDDIDLIAIDSKDLDSGLSMGDTRMQLVGDSPPLAAGGGRWDRAADEWRQLRRAVLGPHDVLPDADTERHLHRLRARRGRVS